MQKINILKKFAYNSIFSKIDIIGIRISPFENMVYVGIGFDYFTIRAFSLEGIKRLHYPIEEGQCVDFRSSFNSHKIYCGFKDGSIRVLDPELDFSTSININVPGKCDMKFFILYFENNFCREYLIFPFNFHQNLSISESVCACVLGMSMPISRCFTCYAAPNFID